MASEYIWIVLSEDNKLIYTQDLPLKMGKNKKIKKIK